MARSHEVSPVASLDQSRARLCEKSPGLLHGSFHCAARWPGPSPPPQELQQGLRFKNKLSQRHALQPPRSSASGAPCAECSLGLTISVAAAAERRCPLLS